MELQSLETGCQMAGADRQFKGYRSRVKEEEQIHQAHTDARHRRIDAGIAAAAAALIPFDTEQNQRYDGECTENEKDIRWDGCHAACMLLQAHRQQIEKAQIGTPFDIFNGRRIEEKQQSRQKAEEGTDDQRGVPEQIRAVDPNQRTDPERQQQDHHPVVYQGDTVNRRRAVDPEILSVQTVFQRIADDVR